MKCPLCGGPMAEGFAPFHVDRHGYHVQWEAIPAWVCNQCGEPCFETSVVNSIHQTIEALDRQNETLRARKVEGFLRA